MNKPTILTGLRANSEFHLGNYLGGILPMVKMQKDHAREYQINMFVPDLHSFTTPIEHSTLFGQILSNLRVYVASGLDINQEDTYIYRQSFIPAHSELTWILSCFTGFGELNRMTQFKDKQSALTTELHKDSSPVVTGALFTYPVLMAADILLYGAELVPVGEDQRQHLELSRDIALRMNHKFDQDLFIVPHEWKKQLEFTERDRGVRIRSLRNPEKKMSKSIEDPAGTILLSDSPEVAAKKVMGATTDSLASIQLDWENQPGISNLLQISALLENKHLNEVEAKWQGKSNYGELKKYVADQISMFLSNLQQKIENVDNSAMQQKLQHDEAAMNKIANETLLRVQKAIGLRQ
jgi:tryptophanyl-tRNA synthetase